MIMRTARGTQYRMRTLFIIGMALLAGSVTAASPAFAGNVISRNAGAAALHQAAEEARRAARANAANREMARQANRRDSGVDLNGAAQRHRQQ
jgi:hypothetical protein